MTGLGSLFHIHLTQGPILGWRDARRSDLVLQQRFFLGMLNRGIVIAPRGTGCVSGPAITEEHIDHFVRAAHESNLRILMTLERTTRQMKLEWDRKQADRRETFRRFGQEHKLAWPQPQRDREGTFDLTCGAHRRRPQQGTWRLLTCPERGRCGISWRLSKDWRPERRTLACSPRPLRTPA